LSCANAAASQKYALGKFVGYVQINTNRAKQGIAQFERALALDPNQAAAYAPNTRGPRHARERGTAPWLKPGNKEALCVSTNAPNTNASILQGSSVKARW
jgi:hypothetical protein